MTDIAVHVADVSKKFRMYHERNQSLKSAIMRRKISVHEDFWALRDISFDVPAGSTFGLIGSNGSGKSTLLNCSTPENATISSNLPWISLRLMPRIEPFRKMFSRPESSGWKPDPTSRRAATLPFAVIVPVSG